MNATGTSQDTPPTYRAMTAVVILLGVLILLALGALIAGLVLKSGVKHTEASPAQAFRTQIAAPPGAHIVGTTFDDGRMLVHIAGSGGDMLVIVDPATGRELGRVTLGPQP